MKGFISITLIFLLVVLSSSQINFAQDVPSLPGKVDRVLNTRTSPFSPPEDSDRSFSTDKAPKLDTGCIFRSSGPITFNIEIKRFLGPLKADGTLQNTQRLINNGLVSREIELIMPAFDVDSGTSQPPVQPELDRVSVNGFEVGFLRGQNNQWVNNSFKIPIDKIKFANKGTGGGEPSGGINQIRIDIDTANSSESWCTSIDWGAMRFRAMSPVILIHGNGSDGEFFERQQFTQELVSKGIVFDNSINMSSNPVATNGNKLNTLIASIMHQWGAKNVHLIAHSKGGLDTREYLAKYQRSHDEDFKVLSLTTLSTPHNGSVLADLSEKRREAIRNAGILGRIEYEGFPDFTAALQFIDEDLIGVDNGRSNLTTTFVSNFNRSNIPLLSSTITFSTIGADADLNSNTRIDGNPDEYAGLRSESTTLTVVHFIHEPTATGIVNIPYQILRKTRGINITYRDQCIPSTNICIKVATLVSIDNPIPLGNDALVTIPSSQGEGSIGPRTTNRRVFTGGAGRDHSTVANGVVAQTVIPWLIQIDKTKGGLK